MRLYWVARALYSMDEFHFDYDEYRPDIFVLQLRPELRRSTNNWIYRILAISYPVHPHTFDRMPGSDSISFRSS